MHKNGLCNVTYICLGILLSTYYVPVSAWHCPAVDKTSVYPGPLSPLHYLGR